MTDLSLQRELAARKAVYTAARDAWMARWRGPNHRGEARARRRYAAALDAFLRATHEATHAIMGDDHTETI
jgi:hypothetical protein